MKIYNPTTLPTGTNRGPNILIDPSKGIIFFSKLLLQKLNGNSVSFLQDEEKIENWFILPDEDGYQLKVKRNSALICNKALCEMILKSSSLDVKQTRFPVSNWFTPETGYAILTKGAQQKPE